MTFLVALMLEDRGVLDLEARVADYWPEFAQAGKEDVRVKHLLSHSAGLPGFSRPFEPAELYDWDFACADLASQAPWWEVGAHSGYHAITQGYLIGEVVRRVTGKSFGTFFREEVAEKVGADFHIGVNPKHFDRIADRPSFLEPRYHARKHGFCRLASGRDTCCERTWQCKVCRSCANSHGE